MPDEESATRAVEKTLGQPASAEFSDNTWKIRTNLIITSIISATTALAGLHIHPESSVLGLRFSGLDDYVVRSTLLWINGYLLVHFLWSAFDSLLEWRLRVTGTRVAFVTSARIASEDGDYPGDPRNSTLYNWWAEQADRVGNISKSIVQIEALLTSLREDLDRRYKNGDSENQVINACASSILSTHSRLTDLNHSLTRLRNIFESQRPSVSLKRFDSWFELFLRSQNLRWLAIEFGVPIVLGLVALYLLSNK